MTVKQPSRRNLHPRNQRSVQIAQNTLKRVTPLAQEQYNNALNVNGYDSIVYNRLFNGRKCSCSKVAKDSPSVLDEDGNATQEHINSILTGGKFGIRKYNTQTSCDTGAFSFDSSQADLTSIGDESGHTITDDISQPDAELITPYDEDDATYFEQDLGSDMQGKCGVCYGNTYVGGFNVFNGVRLVLDTTYFSQPVSRISLASTKKTTIVETEMPNKFNMEDTGYAVFQVTLPRNVLTVDRVRVWDNFNPVNALLEIKRPSDVSFSTLSVNNILNFVTGTPVLIKVSGVRYFTHVELQFNSSYVPVKIEYPRLTKTGDLSVLEAIDGVSLVVGPSVSSVQPWDIIVDNVFRKIWRVTSSNWFNDSFMNIHGWDIQARLVQEYELQSNLPVRKIQNKPTTNFNR